MSKIHIDDLIERIAEYEEECITHPISSNAEKSFNYKGCECCNSKACDTRPYRDIKNVQHDLCSDCENIIINSDPTCLQYSADDEGYINQ